MDYKDNACQEQENKILNRIVAFSEEFLQTTSGEINYSRITDNILYISGAKNAAFNLYDEDGIKFTTVALSGPMETIEKVTTLLGFNLLGKVWENNSVRAEKMRSYPTIHTLKISEYVEDLLGKSRAAFLEKTLNIGEVILVKILKENILIGSFVLIMPEGVKFKNNNYVEIYTRQVGLLLTRSRSEAKLIESEMLLRSVFAAAGDPLFIIDRETGDIIDVNEAACGLYGYSRDEILKLNAIDLSAEPNETRKALHKPCTQYPARHHKRKDGTVFIVEITASSFELKGRSILATSMRDITERKKAEEELKLEQKRLAGIIEGTNVGTWEWNVQTGETVFNQRWAEIIGYTLDEISPVTIETWARFAHPKDIKKSSEQLAKVFSGELDYYDIDCRVKHRNGSWIWIHDRGKVISWTPDRKPLFMSGTHTDISARKKTEEALRASEQRYRIITEQSPIAIERYNEKGELIHVNPACLDLFGVSDVKSIQRFNLFDDPNVLDIHKEKLKKGEAVCYQALFDFEKVKEYKLYKTVKSGSIWIDVIITPIKNNANKVNGYLLHVSNITERKKAEQDIIYLSFHDQLTGLYNRRFFEEEITRLDTERQLPLSIIIGDLNGLKLINDVFGHNEGDNLLKKTSEILKRVCRSDDILARWGGDEFVMLLPGTGPKDSEEIIQRIKNECGNTNIRKIPVSLSLGAAQKALPVQDIQAVVIDAEINMYKNKLAQKEILAGSIIFALEQALYETSSETKQHIERIKELALKLGKSINLTPKKLDELSLLASFHDIGKVAISEKILLKKGKLTEKEWSVIKRHPEIGFNIAQSFPQMSHIAKPILSCHENWDGSGYPMGLKGETIPLISRIILIADAYDVMTNGGPYKEPVSREDAINELKIFAGTQFDPELVYNFAEILEG